MKEKQARHFRCDDELWQEITNISSRLRINNSDFIRMAIVALIENYKNKPILDENNKII